MDITYLDPTKTTGTDGYINYRLSGGGSNGGGNRGSNGLGCGGLISIILLVITCVNEIAEEFNEGITEFFICIGIIIVIVAVLKFMNDN